MTSPLRRKRQTTLLNTKVRSRSRLRRRIAALFGFRRPSQLGLLVAVVASLIASVANAADELAPIDSVRLSTDQTLENATGVGAPPSTWPREELVIDVLHKAVYSVATGLLAERLIRPDLQSGRGRRSH